MKDKLVCPFWERTKKLIKTNNLTHEKFALKMNISYSTLKYWMCYGLVPDVDTACQIADLLEVPLEYLVKGERQTKNTESKKRKTAAVAIMKMAYAIERNTEMIV